MNKFSKFFANGFPFGVIGVILFPSSFCIDGFLDAGSPAGKLFLYSSPALPFKAVPCGGSSLVSSSPPPSLSF